MRMESTKTAVMRGRHDEDAAETTRFRKSLRNANINYRNGWFFGAILQGRSDLLCNVYVPMAVFLLYNSPVFQLLQDAIGRADAYAQPL